MTFDYDNKTYTFNMTRAGVRAAEAAGLVASEIAEKPQSALGLLFYAALYSTYSIHGGEPRQRRRRHARRPAGQRRVAVRERVRGVGRRVRRAFQLGRVESDTDDPPKEGKSYDSLTEFFNDLCPQVMSIGVSYDDFWHGEPDLVTYAIAAEEVRAKNKTIHDDMVAWNTGRYVMMGVGVVLSQAFSRSSTAKYPDEPLIGPHLDEALAEQARERELQRQHNDFLALAGAMWAAQHPTTEEPN